MQEKSKYVRNLTIGAITGGLIAGGIQLALIEKKPFINDYIDTYMITTDTIIRTTEGLTRLKTSVQYLTIASESYIGVLCSCLIRKPSSKKLVKNDK